MRSATLFAGSCLLLPTASAQTKPNRVASPEVLADHRVTFRLLAPEAHTVSITGDFWQEQGHSGQLVKEQDGVWSFTTEPLGSDLYSYSFQMDGVSLPDPADALTKPGIAGTESAFFVPGTTAALLQTANVPHGEVRTVFYHSLVAGSTRRMHIYLPPGYENTHVKLPVLYLLHGGGDDDSTWESVGRVNDVLDNLIADNRAKPMIVVMPALWILNPPLSDAGHAQNETLFALSLRRDIMPYVEAHYRVLPSPATRALGGLGDGRDFLPTLVWQTLGQFNSILSVSGGVDHDQFSELQKRYPGVVEAPANIRAIHFYMGDGTMDHSFAAARSMADELQTIGYKVQFWQSDKTHGWPEFRYNFLQFATVAFR